MKYNEIEYFAFNMNRNWIFRSKITRLRKALFLYGNIAVKNIFSMDNFSREYINLWAMYQNSSNH